MDLSIQKVLWWFWHMAMKLSTRNNGLGEYKYYEIDKKIIHYSYLILGKNIKLSIYKGKPNNKVLLYILIQELR